MKRDQMKTGVAYASGRSRSYSSRSLCAVLDASEVWVRQHGYDAADDRMQPSRLIPRFRSYSDVKGVLIAEPRDSRMPVEEFMAAIAEIEVPAEGWTGERIREMRQQKYAEEHGYKFDVIPAQNIQDTWDNYLVAQADEKERRRKADEAAQEARNAEIDAYAAVKDMMGEQTDLLPSANYQPFRTMDWRKLDAILRAAIEQDRKTR